MNEYALACRLFLAEMSTYSEILPVELTDEILVEYSDDKIISIINKLEDKYLNEGIGLLIIGISAWIAYSKRKAEKIRNEFLSSQNKMCDHLIGKEKELCLKNNLKNANEKKISTMKRYMNKCSKLRNPEKCKYQMKLEIKKMMKKVEL